jgi:hypothetical protein
MLDLREHPGYIIGTVAALLIFAVLAFVTNGFTQSAPSSPVAFASSQPSSTAVAATPTATAAPTPSPTPVVNSECILSIPAQFGTDLTPVVIHYVGADEATCSGYLAKQNTGATGWEKDHPATRVASVPSGAPACDVTVKGVRLVIYGTGAAKLSCQAFS